MRTEQALCEEFFPLWHDATMLSILPAAVSACPHAIIFLIRIWILAPLLLWEKRSDFHFSRQVWNILS